jgi:hypothetical protein
MLSANSSRRWIILSAVVAAGCSASGPRLIPVKGKVTAQGKPVPKLIVHFVPEVGRESWGATNAEGDYKLLYDRQREGALLGKHSVWVEPRLTTPLEEQALAAGTLRMQPGLAQILDKYGDRQNPALSVDVKDDNQVIDLQLD